MEDHMPHIDDWLAENYSAVRLERGWSWAELAADFDRQGASLLAEWARQFTAANQPRAAAKAKRETTSSRPTSTRKS
jgi:transposase-like protein